MNSEVENKQKSLSSIRLLKIMECMSEKRFPMRLIDLSKELDMSQPTVLRYLNALSTAGYVYQDPVSGGYAMTWGICRLSNEVLSNSALSTMVHPFLRQLSDSLNVGMLLATQREGALLYLDVVANPKLMETVLRIGHDAPIHSTSSGKLMMSYLSDEEIRKILNQIKLEKLTENTITDKHLLFEEIMRIRERGYSYDNEECEIGHRCVSVALRGYTNNVVAAISAFGAVEKISDKKIEKEIIPLMLKVAKQISFILGYRGRYGLSY